jgi:hypothetical protein
MNQSLIKKLKQLLILSSLFILSSYLCLLIFPLIQLKYLNPNNFNGILALKHFNPLNNYLRYLFYITAMPTLFFFLKKLLQEKKYLWLRIIFIIVLSWSLFLSTTQIYLHKNNNLDPFHDSEQLGVGSAVYFFNKIPYKDMFFLHGAFSDPGISTIAFKLFGPSIGSFYLTESLLKLLGFILLIILASLLLRDHWLFYSASILLYGSLFEKGLWRELVTFLYLMIVVLVIKKVIKAFLGFFLLGFLAFACLYYSADRGFYLVVLSLVFWLIFALFKEDKFSQLKTLGAINKQLVKNIPNLLMLLMGFLAANLVGLVLFHKEGLMAFYQETFVHLPAMKPFLDEYIYPAFSMQSFSPHWWPIFLMSLYIIFLVNQILYAKKTLKADFILPLFFTLTSLIFFRSALGRSDIWHIAYILHHLFLAGFVILDYFLAKNRQAIATRLLVYCLTLLFFFNPFFYSKRIINLPNASLADIRIFFSLPKISDNYWLNYESEMVRDYLLANTTKKDKIFVFDNTAVYYYLAQRDNPTRYYTAWFGIGDKYQQEIRTDLQKNPPKYILYCDNLCDKIDGLTNADKLPLVYQWILKNYHLEKIIGSVQIYRQKTL